MSSASGPIASRAARTIASSSASLARPNGPQPILNARKPCACSCASCSRQRLRLVHQQRGVGPHPLAIASAQQAPDRLPGGLAENVPQRDVDAADRVRDGAAAPQPEGVLVQLLADALRLQRVLAAIQRLQHASAARTRRSLVKTLPKPVRPSSVRTTTSVWTVYSGRSSSLHPPLGVAPAKPTA